jgi:hypothetical protein
MSNKSPILIILKPEVFDTGIIRENPEIFLENTVLPDPNILLKELFLGIITEYEWPYEIIWSEADIRELYNQPHHLISEPWFPLSRRETLVEIYRGRKMQFYIVYGNEDDPSALNIRKKSIRKRYLKNPNVAFYSLFHVSDSIVDGKREIEIYQKYVQ